jgi:NAD(P)-dependent dehydrogenase (short-subunit alcohol dehydrogenase family)
MNEAGRIAIVTGASMGIGWATAEALARAGFKVFGTSRRPVNGGPRGVSMHACDVTDEDSVNAFVSSARHPYVTGGCLRGTASGPPRAHQRWLSPVTVSTAKAAVNPWTTVDTRIARPTIAHSWVSFASFMWLPA